MLNPHFRLHLNFVLLLCLFCQTGLTETDPSLWERLYCSASEILAKTECCRSARVDFKYTEFQRTLRQKLFGQPIAADVIARVVSNHWDGRRKPRKALVLALHGPTGVGKSFVTNILASYTFARGKKSQFYHFFSAMLDFPHPQLTPKYIDELRAWIRGNVSYCEKSLFVFDEVEKMPLRVFDSLKPFLDYESVIGGIDFSRCIFVFLSNTGHEVIMDNMIDWKRQGKDRATFPVEKMDRKLSEHAFVSGSLKGSELLKHGLISRTIPFLPLEMGHVLQCIKESLAERGDHRLAGDNGFLRDVLKEIPFVPDEEKFFAKFGCKRVAEKVDEALDAIMWNRDASEGEYDLASQERKDQRKKGKTEF